MILSENVKRNMGKAKKIAMALTLFAFLFMGSAYKASLKSPNEKPDSHSYKLTAQKIESILNHQEMPVAVNGNSDVIFNLVQALYIENKFAPLWTTAFQQNQASKELSEVLRKSYYFGIDTMYYTPGQHTLLLNGMKQGNSLVRLIETRAQFEILSTYNAFLFLIHINKGIAYADTISTNDSDFMRLLPLELNNLLHRPSFAEALTDFQPEFKEYQNLVKALKEYIETTDMFSTGFKTGLLDVNKATYLISMLGYPENKADTSDKKAHIREFQKQYKLDTTGLFDEGTLAAIELGIKRNYKIVSLNLERLRQSNFESDNFVWVNIPSYTLKIYENKHLANQFNVIIGRPETPTKEITSSIAKIVVNPSWFVPRSITSELIYRLKTDSTYLDKKGFQLLSSNFKPLDYKSVDWSEVTVSNFNFRLVQKPSERNALGTIKFLFDNPYSIYLHDTNARYLFQKEDRAFSHGCVRLENPHQFADYILNKTEAGISSVSDFIRNKTTKVIELENKMDIYIRYVTCEADENNKLVFHKDVYGWDEQQLAKEVLRKGEVASL